MDSVVFVVSKIFTPFFNPLCLLLIAVAVILLRARKTLVSGGKKRLFVWAVVIWGAAFVFGTSLLAEALTRAWEEPVTRPESVDPSAYDAVLVLGGSVDPSTSIPGNPSLNDSAERLTAAAALSRAIPYIVFTGGSGDIYHQDLKESDVSLDLLLSLGVPREKILLESESRNTFENAAFTRNLLVQKGIHNVLLLTSALHMRRSAAIFEKAGFVRGVDSGGSGDTIRFTPYVVDSVSQTLDFPECIIPDARNMTRSFGVGREIVGYIIYKILGYL